mmetsp:Transcript_20195/g.35955  ORF Transcript_20195/g.35955 Transcript_20195/m.35955 type:complete len:206 (+) Transcript_20195:74-691(+)|eukprot:CAMPEP_0197656294 /NCGR_PEP_ID=MMETSP1338-20131121/41205_1 /TAXON_ID=43686 ORGANISM="Pelagodinium beii, Strain RCC1491" /NCGR_SAMPLE_ID=MMETSP1338 /ASSEMBLY_ACC=CAM_ASM_000754 /LENGTH=205 /DNA_ID=CAMNT_0043232227 /DNA_START=70 /DNA_END=687 /DNA_ORIENTATION=+
MTMQMDDNRKYSPSDWLTIQRTEFNKEADIRMTMSYGDFSEQLKNEHREVHPAMLPRGVRRVPENREMPLISKGWQSKAYRNMEPLRPEVASIGPSRAPSSHGSSKARHALHPEEGFERPASEMDLNQNYSPVYNDMPRQNPGNRVPMLARTVVNAPASLGRGTQGFSRTQMSSSTSSLWGRTVMEPMSYSGCRRTGATGLIFGD